MTKFVDDEAGYLQWLDAHPQGFVVNTNRAPNSRYLKLHRTACKHIGRDGQGNYTRGSYIKMCSEDSTELRRLADKIGGALGEGCYCLIVN